MNWSDVLTKSPIYLNLGGNICCHPRKGYENYISVDMTASHNEWSIEHDIRTKFPIPDNTVTRIHTEDFLEHIRIEEIKVLIAECFRVLKPGGIMRIGVPDYNNPKDRPYLKKGHDTRDPKHITLTTYELMKEIIEKSPFCRYKFYHYWKGDNFIHEKIDYSLGMIRRTPDNDRRCKRTGFAQNIIGNIRDFQFKLSRGFRYTDQDLSAQNGHKFHVTSIVVDLFKD